MKSEVRAATLSGMFYPKDAKELEETLRSLFSSTATYPAQSRIFGILAPHAGYMYSGKIAAVSYSRIPESFDGTFLVIGPSHAGCPTCTSDVFWETPIGTLEPDTELVQALQENGIPIRNDFMNVQENSLETQMPFIKFRFLDAKIVPVLLGDQSYGGAAKTAASIISAISQMNRDVIVIASGDGSHYVPRDIAEKDDLTVLSAISKLDTKNFYEVLMNIQPSMCGYGCIAVMADVCKHFGAREARVLLYDTSGSVTGDTLEVVGYAAMEVI